MTFQPELHLKIVYVGPPSSGRESSIRGLYELIQAADKGDLLTFRTESIFQIFFDFVPVTLYSVPIPRWVGLASPVPRYHIYMEKEIGEAHARLSEPLRHVLHSVDGIVFVADSHPDALASNQYALYQVATVLEQDQRSLQDIPLVLQYNKRDLPDALSIRELNAALNIFSWPWVETVAAEPSGSNAKAHQEGLLTTLSTLAQLILSRKATIAERAISSFFARQWAPNLVTLDPGLAQEKHRFGSLCCQILDEPLQCYGFQPEHGKPSPYHQRYRKGRRSLLLFWFHSKAGDIQCTVLVSTSPRAEWEIRLLTWGEEDEPLAEPASIELTYRCKTLDDLPQLLVEIRDDLVRDAATLLQINEGD
jgi:mutual gliding-motility protein MglA